MNENQEIAGNIPEKNNNTIPTMENKKGKVVRKGNGLREGLFCSYFFNDKSDTFLDCQNSGLKAGYTLLSARHIITEAKKNGKYAIVCKGLQEFQEKMSDSSITIEKVLRKLNYLINMIENEKERKKSGYTGSDTLKALELCGKYLAMFTDKVLIQETQPVVLIRNRNVIDVGKEKEKENKNPHACIGKGE